MSCCSTTSSTAAARDQPGGAADPRARGGQRPHLCVLLRKDRPSARATQVDYVGFEIPDEFSWLAYGLDFNNYYRNLPDIVTN